MSETHVMQKDDQEYLTIVRDLLEIKVWPIDMWKKELLKNGFSDDFPVGPIPTTAVTVVDIIRAGKRQPPQYVTDNHVITLQGLCVSLKAT